MKIWSHALIGITATAALAGCSQPASAPASNADTSEAAEAALTPAASGYAEAGDGLKVHYEVFGKGEPIVVMAGGLMDLRSMAKVIEPLSRNQQVIGIDLEGHGRTALRTTPMSHERNGDDVAAVLRHLKIGKADVAGYSHGGDAALRMAIQHPEMVRNLVLISTAAGRSGWYPETRKAMEGLSAASAEPMKQTKIYERYLATAPHPEQFGMLLDRMGALLSKDYDWRSEVDKLQTPTLLIFADHDAVSTAHIAEFFGLFGGGLRDPGLTGKPRFSQARLAILPGYTHYNIAEGPDAARIIEGYLTQPISQAPTFDQS